MGIETICVLGAGAMGDGIAQVCAQAGFQVCLHDIEAELVQQGLERIRESLQGSVARKKVTVNQAEAILSRIRTTTSLNQASPDADLVIEAIVEDREIKKKTFKHLDRLCPDHTVFASNTSYQSITEMAAVTRRTDRFLGMHWFNPPQIMRGIEVVRTERTSQETVDAIVALCGRLGKDPALCKDSPGFVANRLLQVWRNESLRLYDEGVSSFHEIDTAFKSAYNFRMGPFELADLVGLDIAIAGNETMYAELRDDIFKPPRCLITKFRAGEYGRKTGRGFYRYD